MSVYSDLDAQYPQTITGNSQWHILHLKDQHGCCLFSHCTVSGLTSGSRLFHYLSRTSYIRGWWRQLHIAMATEPAVLRHIWAEEGKYMRVYMWRNKVCEHFRVDTDRQTTRRRGLIIVGHLTVLENDIHRQFSRILRAHVLNTVYNTASVHRYTITTSSSSSITVKIYCMFCSTSTRTRGRTWEVTSFETDISRGGF